MDQTEALRQDALTFEHHAIRRLGPTACIGCEHAGGGSRTTIIRPKRALLRLALPISFGGRATGRIMAKLARKIRKDNPRNLRGFPLVDELFDKRRCGTRTPRSARGDL